MLPHSYQQMLGSTGGEIQKRHFVFIVKEGYPGTVVEKNDIEKGCEGEKNESEKSESEKSESKKSEMKK